jgi:hypothetical protein
MGLIDWIVDAVTGTQRTVAEAAARAGSEVGATGPPCGIERRFGLPNRCRGACPTNQRCIVTETERYLVFFRQAKSCTCALQLPP